MSVLRKPIITEKATALNTQRQYVFEVEPKANKIQIRQAVEKQFSVDVTTVRTVNIRGKHKLQMTKRGRFSGKTAARKKAYVTVKEGQTIDIGTGTNE
jgi:large subunit ribosomal protein L23